MQVKDSITVEVTSDRVDSSGLSDFTAQTDDLAVNILRGSGSLHDKVSELLKLWDQIPSRHELNLSKCRVLRSCIPI